MEGVEKTLWKRSIWTELCTLQNLYVEALTSNVTVFGDRAFEKVIRVK